MYCAEPSQNNKKTVVKKHFFYSLLFILFVLLTGYSFSVNAAPVQKTSKTTAHSAPKVPRPIRYLTANGRRYMNLKDLAMYYHLKFSFNKTGAVMYNEGNKRIEFTYNKRAGSINGVNVTFFFPMLIRQNNAYISELDFQKILEPSLKGKVYRKHQLKNIMLDPGHGGSDPGACGLNKNEETVNLEVALKLKKALTNLGFNVIMTRSSDKTVSLQDRAAHCQKVKPDLYISLHCNSAENKSVSGIETFQMTPANAPSSADKEPQNIQMPVNEFDQNSYRLAYEIQKSLKKSFPATSDRGVKHARFYVLKHATCPAVLIEMGFISNQQEGKNLASDIYQVKLMDAILNGMQGYLQALK